MTIPAEIDRGSFVQFFPKREINNFHDRPGLLFNDCCWRCRLGRRRRGNGWAGLGCDGWLIWSHSTTRLYSMREPTCPPKKFGSTIFEEPVRSPGRFWWRPKTLVPNWSHPTRQSRNELQWIPALNVQGPGQMTPHKRPFSTLAPIHQPLP